MGVINSHFYSINEGIAYPIDETATLLSNENILLPSNVIVDLSLRWPGVLGEFAFLSSLSVTPGLVTVTVQASTTIYGSSGFKPLAAVAIPRPVVKGKQYAISAQNSQVGGWIVFGSGVDGPNFSCRFFSPAQALITARSARPFSLLPVSSLQVLNSSAPLSGIVKLLGSDPLSVTAEDREINGVNRSCIIVSLNSGSITTNAFPVPAAAAALLGTRQTNLLAEYAGPCSGIPESGTCGSPEPIQSINAISPDCDGLITVSFSGCASLTQLTGPCGCVIDCGLGLSNACAPPQIPDSSGNLPSAYTPATIPPYTPTPTPTPTPGPESAGAGGDLPQLECFYRDTIVMSDSGGLWAGLVDDTDHWRPCAVDSASLPYLAVVVRELNKTFGLSESYGAGSMWVYGSLSAAVCNFSLVGTSIDHFGTLNRAFTTHVKMLEGPPGAKHNAGIVINCRLATYFAASVDYDSQALYLLWYNGSSFIEVAEYAAPGIQLDKWYSLKVTIVPASEGQATIGLTLQSLADSSVSLTGISETVSGLLPEDGLFGFIANRAVSRFSYFYAEEYS